jgi:hypothetical protein
MNNWDVVMLQLLQKAADHLAYRFHGKMYLVGSYLQKGDKGHDVDLILVLDGKRYSRLFCNLEAKEDHDKVLSFRTKQKLWIEFNYVRTHDIDFKVEREEIFYDHKGDRLLLAEYPGTKTEGVG